MSLVKRFFPRSMGPVASCRGLRRKGGSRKVGNKRIREEGLVRHDEMMKWLHDRRVVLRGGDLDEAPQAYRRLPDVLKAHAGTIRIRHTLRPLGVAMAGRDIVDPYKD